MKVLRDLRILRIIPLLITICLFSFPAYAKYSGGTGEPNDPYRISTAEDLILLGDTPEDYDKHFVLTADIDLDPNLPGRKVFDKAVIAPDTDAAKDYYQGTPFTGVFDGNNFKINALTIDTGPEGNDFLGLFGTIGTGSHVRNLGLQNVIITGSDFSVGIGGLAADNEGGSISNCYVVGNIRAGDASRGLGGLAGGNIRGRISKCCFVGNIGNGNGSLAFGGLVGTASQDSIRQCYARSNLSTGNDSHQIGGLVGAGGNISDCYSVCNIVAGDRTRKVGCLVGGSFTTKDDGDITNCYASGTVNIGIDYSSVGGLAGNVKRVTNSYWDIQASGLALSSGGTAKTTAELMEPNTFLGWNCDGEVIWTIDPGNDYPRLAWENWPGIPIPSYRLSDFLPGSGTVEEPYQISSRDHLDKVGRFPCEWDKHFVLMEDIDLSFLAGDSFHIIGASLGHPFSGVFDGNGHVIRNLSYRVGDLMYVGIFGSISGQIRELGLENVDISSLGKLECAGGLGGENYGSIINCYARVSISGYVLMDVGGLVGYNWGAIISCCANSNIGVCEGDNLLAEVGGLTGRNYGSVTDCYATGRVSGSGESKIVGGLVGYNWGPVSNCFAGACVSAGDGSTYVGGLIGDMCSCHAATGTCEDSFWDIEASCQLISDGGTGKTTAEMKTRSTFTSAGWDFVGETANGTEDIWWILEGKDYPRLCWERTVWFPDYMPVSPAQHGIKTFEWTYGKSGQFTSQIDGTITVNYGNGSSLTGVRITNFFDSEEGGSTGFVYNDGSSVKILGIEDHRELGGCWFISSDANLTSHSSMLSFDSVTDGMMIDQRGYYLVKQDCSASQQEWDRVIIFDIQDVKILEGKYNNAIIMWDLRTDREFKPLDWSGKDTEMGIILPTSADTGGYAVTGFEIFGRNRGIITYGDHHSESGQLERLAELKQVQQAP